MKPAIPGLTNRAYLALLQGYGSDRAVFHAASVYQQGGGNILRALCIRHKIDPDKE